MDWLKQKIIKLDSEYTKGCLFLLKKAASLGQYRKILRMTRRPVLIGGCGRSGTTLLQSILSAHPHLCVVPGETYAFCEQLYSENTSGSPAFRVHQVYLRLLEMGSFDSTKRWVEKSPKNVQVIGRLIDYFGPGLRFINIVRDGRDVITSRHPSEKHRYWVSPKRWVEDVSAGMAWEEHDQVLTIRYEDLVADPMSVMRSICRFLDEPFCKDALQRYPESASIQSSGAWSHSGREVHQDSVERWKNEEHRDVVGQLLDMKEAQQLLDHYGYSAD